MKEMTKHFNGGNITGKEIDEIAESFPRRTAGACKGCYYTNFFMDVAERLTHTMHGRRMKTLCWRRRRKTWTVGL
jgi:hypothetical protein